MRRQSEVLQTALRRGEVTAVTAHNSCGSLICPEEVSSHILLLFYEVVAPGENTKKKERKKEKMLNLPS